jgi:pimeloyl-ACP methyl ester carboxylesterase
MGAFERYKPAEAARDYLLSFEGERFGESMRYVRTYPEQLPISGDLLPKIETPVQIIAGARDPVVPPVNAEYLHERLPKSKLDIMNTLHFIWEDATDAYAALVTTWCDGGHTKSRLVSVAGTLSKRPKGWGLCGRVYDRQTRGRIWR